MNFHLTADWMLTLQRVEQVEHARGDDGLLQASLLGQWLALLVKLIGIGIVFERALDKARELSVVAIVEDGEVLTVSSKVGRQALAAKGVDDGVGRERGCLAGPWSASSAFGLREHHAHAARHQSQTRRRSPRSAARSRRQPSLELPAGPRAWPSPHHRQQ